MLAGDAFVTTRQESLRWVLRQKPGIFGPPAYFTPHWGRACQAVKKLHALDPALAASGHGPPLGGAALREGLARLAQDFDKLAVPVRGRYRHTSRDNGRSKSVEAEEAEWLHYKCDRSGIESPDLAAAPLGTDQEAGGAITTPRGRRKYSEGERIIYDGDEHTLH